MALEPKHRGRKTLAGLLVTLAAGLFYYASQPGGLPQAIHLPPPGTYHVTKVIDGDTIEVNYGGHTETVRYIGIDTPETHDPRKPVQCYGLTAAAKNQQLVGGQNVRLQADPADDDRDKYHRLLRYVYLPGGTFVNQQLVEQGYAFAYVVFPNSKLDQFRAWEQEARAADRGLWSACNVDASTDIKQTAGAKNSG